MEKDVAGEAGGLEKAEEGEKSNRDFPFWRGRSGGMGNLKLLHC